MNNLKISFIVPLFNHVEYSRRMLDSLLKTIPKGLDYEVVMVDDGSSDGTREWLGRLADGRIRAIVNDRNIGYAKSNNRAAEVVTGSILGLLNNDLILLEGWLEPMLEVLCSPSAPAGIVGNIQFRTDDHAVDHAGVEVNHLAKVEHIRALPPAARTATHTFAVTGACCLVLRRDFIAVGGFDERYVNGGEDIDLCLKLRAHRKYAYVANASRVEHHIGLSRGGATERQERNSRLLFDKWNAVIHEETKGAWMRILSSPTEASSTQIIEEFHLAETFKTSPHAVAGILAKSACLREETRWREILDSNYGPGSTLAVTATRGFLWDRTSPYPWINGCARFVLPEGWATRNVFITGRAFEGGGVDGRSREEIEIVLQINGVQKRSWSKLVPGNFNLGIERPASIPRQPTLVRVTIAGPPGKRQGEPGLPHEIFRVFRFFNIIVDDKIALDLGR